MGAFHGAATRLGEGDIARAAATLGCDAAAVRAVIAVESGGGFLPDGRPRILFERHLFRRATKGRHDAVRPDLSAATPGGWRGGAAEHARLEAAIALDRAAALGATSWGLFQILGANWRAAGHDGLEPFVAAMVAGEGAQLDAFVAFVRSIGLDGVLRRHDWAGFARGYNGPGYRRNAYDAKLASAHAAASVLRRGAEGPAVADLQRRLGIAADGVYGAATEAAVRAAQARAGLVADGVAGAATLKALAGASDVGKRA